MKTLKLALMALFFMSVNTLASQCTIDGENVTNVVFSNGMFTSKDSASDSSRVLRDEVVKKASSNELLITSEDVNKMKFGYSYNQNEFFLTQLLEIAEQNAYVKDLNDLKEQIAYILGDSEIPNDMAGSLQIQEIIQREVIREKDVDLDRHISTYENMLEKGERVIVLAHSQGNFYANMAYDYIRLHRSDLAERMGIIALATPDERNASGGQHITLDSDVVMTKIVPWVTNNLSSNVSNSNTAGHSFSAILYGDNSGLMLMQFISDLYHSLPVPQIEVNLEPTKLPAPRTGCDVSFYAQAVDNNGNDLPIMYGNISHVPYDNKFITLKVQLDLGLWQNIDGVEVIGSEMLNYNDWDSENVFELQVGNLSNEGFDVEIPNLDAGVYLFIFKPYIHTIVNGVLEKTYMPLNPSRGDTDEYKGYLRTAYSGGYEAELGLQKKLCDYNTFISDAVIDGWPVSTSLVNRTFTMTYRFKFKPDVVQCFHEVQRVPVIMSFHDASSVDDVIYPEFSVSGDEVTFSYSYTFPDSIRSVNLGRPEISGKNVPYEVGYQTSRVSTLHYVSISRDIETKMFKYYLNTYN